MVVEMLAIRASRRLLSSVERSFGLALGTVGTGPKWLILLVVLATAADFYYIVLCFAAQRSVDGLVFEKKSVANACEEHVSVPCLNVC